MVVCWRVAGVMVACWRVAGVMVACSRVALMSFAAVFALFTRRFAFVFARVVWLVRLLVTFFASAVVHLDGALGACNAVGCLVTRILWVRFEISRAQHGDKSFEHGVQGHWCLLLSCDAFCTSFTSAFLGTAFIGHAVDEGTGAYALLLALCSGLFQHLWCLVCTFLFARVVLHERWRVGLVLHDFGHDIVG